MEMRSITKKAPQEMGDKHSHEGQKDRCGNQMSSPTANSIHMSRMFIKDPITVAIQTNTLEKIQERKNPALLLYLPHNSNKVFCFLPVPLFIDNEATF